jgi:Ca2+-binding RTX toxin-like protein
MATIPGTPNPETLPGTDNDDTITGLGGNDRLEGRGGNDLLDGGTGTDTLLGGSGNDTYVVDVLADVVDESVASNGSGYDGVNLALLAAGIYTLPFGVEWARVMSANLGLLIQLIGNALDNQLYGNGGNNNLSGLQGNDYLDGGAGNDTLLGGDGDDGHQGGTGNDSIVGGAGWDFVFYDTATAPVTVNLLAGTATGADIGTDTLSGLEGLAGGAGADTLTGDNGDNEIQGLAGNDSIDGGNGFDSVSYIHATGPVLVDMAAGTSSGADGNDSFVNIEWVKGSSHGDTLIGNGANNTLEERGGSDSLDGAGGFDTVSFWGAAAAVNASLLTGRATSGADTDTLVGIEALSGFNFDDTLTGDSSNNRLEGRGGNDSLIGNDGEDTLIGGAGNDTLDGGNHPANLFDWVDYGQAPGPMVINLQTGVATGDGADALSNIEAVIGSRFDDSLVGANVSLTYFRMGAGNDTIVGNGPGDIIDYSDAPNGVTIIGGASGAGTVTGHGTDVYSGIENLFGSQHADSMVGSSLGEGFRVRNGADTVDGLGGNDRIDYRATGNVVNVNLETGIGQGADGNDVIRNVENLSGSDVNGTDTLVGNAGANRHRRPHRRRLHRRRRRRRFAARRPRQ